MRLTIPVLIASITAVGLGLYVLNADSTAQAGDKTISTFTLKDTTGCSVSLDSLADKRVIVVVFIGTQCPINNYYMPRLVELHKEFSSQGVAFLAINSNRQDTIERIAEHASKNAIPFPVLRDENNVVADRFGARRTPEAFVVNGTRAICYQGRIDDQYGIDILRPKPTRRDLAEAISEMLAGKAVSQPTTSVAGCVIGRVSTARADGAVTFTKDIARILQNHCQECHRPGQIGPMPLMTYEDACAWAETIREVIGDRRMPPWHADHRFGKFSNDRRLPKEAEQALLRWLDDGTPRGHERDMPAPRPWPEGWKIGKPDVVLHMPVEFDVPAQMPRNGVPYKYYYVETNFDEDKWVERAEAKPGAPEVVHHMLVFIVPPDQPFIAGNPKAPVLCGMAPGDMPLMLKPGQAKFVPKRSKLVFQMHYTPNGKAQKDRSYVGLIFAKEPPKLHILTIPVANLFFQIPPGDANFALEASYIMPRDGYAVAYMPHMHLRGKDFQIVARYPDNREETLLAVPRFNFNWQSVYRTIEPVALPQGTKVVCLAHFDNSEKNPNNPDPTQAVRWGDQTWQEMMIGWIDFAFERKK